MNKVELQERLKSENYNTESYCLNGNTLMEGHCLDDRGEVWCTYYFERGVEFEFETFDSEADACNRLYEKIKNDPFMKRRR